MNSSTDQEATYTIGCFKWGVSEERCCRVTVITHRDVGTAETVWGACNQLNVAKGKNYQDANIFGLSAL